MNMIPVPSDLPSVLIVDDDALLLGILQRMARAVLPAGTPVRLARSSAEAHSCLQTMVVDIILTDYTLDGRDGLDLIRAVKQRYPYAVAILSTGIAQDVLEADEASSAVDYYLPKPFSIQDLAMIFTAALR